MKKTHFITFIVLATLALFTSCIQEEAPNAECDILAVDTTYTWFRDNKEILTNDFKLSNDEILFVVKKDVDIDSIEISHESIMGAFTLTQGATIEANNIAKDNNGIYLYFTTYSEDGKWSKIYTVKFIKMPPLDVNHVFGFENFETGSYTTWYETNYDGMRSDIWSSGNAGFKLVAATKPADEYPTTTCAEGLNGDCVKLTTRDTGTMGKLSKMPIAAGSIFIGEFDSSNAMKAPLAATRMGMQIVPENAKPVSFTGFYKYTPGEKFTDKNKKEVIGRRDACAIYAVLFEVDPTNFVPLNGSDVTSSDRIVLIAEMQNPGEPAEWEKFEIPFVPMNGKEFDYVKLANNEYAITIVASSSKDGAFFEGAIGSTLFVDEMRIEWEQK